MLARALAAAAVLSLLVLVPATAAQTGGGFKVTSTLDGKPVLPHRIHWLGYPSLSAAKIKEVDFLIDGRVAWVEHSAPYVYGSDENGRDEGYLVTSWLSPGEHHFVVRAIATDGTTSTDTVVSRVLPSPAPPAGLAGTWERLVDTTGAPKPGSSGNPTSTILAPGTWKITFEKRWIHDSAPRKVCLPEEQQQWDRIRISRRLLGNLDADPRPGRGDLPPAQRQARRGRLVVLPERPSGRLQLDGQRQQARTLSDRRPRRLRHPRLCLGRHLDTRRLSYDMARRLGSRRAKLMLPARIELGHNV